MLLGVSCDRRRLWNQSANG